MLAKNYARPTLDKHRLGEYHDLIGTIQLVAKTEAEAEAGESKPTKRKLAMLPIEASRFQGLTTRIGFVDGTDC